MKNNFTKEEAEKFKGITQVWVIDTMPDGTLRTSLADIDVLSFEIGGVEKIEIFVSDEWGIFSPNEIFLTQEECLAAAWALNHENYIKAMNIYEKNREEILSKMINNENITKIPYRILQPAIRFF